MRERITIYVIGVLLESTTQQDINILKSICLDHTGCIDKKFDLLVSNRTISFFEQYQGKYHFIYQGYFRFDSSVIDTFIDWICERIPYQENNANFMGYIMHEDLLSPEWLRVSVTKHVDCIQTDEKNE